MFADSKTYKTQYWINFCFFTVIYALTYLHIFIIFTFFGAGNFNSFSTFTELTDVAVLPWNIFDCKELSSWVL